MPLEVEGLGVGFGVGAGRVEALKRVDLRVGEGELVAVMGPSGSGKSTLLHVVAGLTAPDRGSVRVEGVDVAGLREGARTAFRRRRVGLVFQAYNLIPALSVVDNVLLPMRVDGREREGRERLDALLERLGLSARREHRPGELSGGEQQRVAVARALITEPALVLADEPTGSLDTVTGQALCALLEELCRERGRAALVVTHEPSVAVWAQRVVVLRDGTNLAEFSTEGIEGPEALAAKYHEVVGAGVEPEVVA